MKIAISQSVRTHPDHPEPPEKFYADALDDTVRAERLGFDYVWFAEHHFRPCQWNASPLVVIGAAATRTSRIRLGTAVLCLPFHDPLRIAEDVAVADILSGGRFDLGVGAGSQYEEFETFGIPMHERFGRQWEAVDLIERCFTEERPFDHKGKYYEYPHIDFTTKPVQKKMPIWVGALGPQNIKRTAEHGYNLFGAANPLYDETLRATGRNPDDFYIGSGPTISLAETKEQAFEAAAEGFLYSVNFYATRKQPDGSLPPPAAAMTMDRLRASDGGGWMSLIADTPENALTRILAWRQKAGRMNHMSVSFRVPGSRNADVERSMELFASKIMPHLH